MQYQVEFDPFKKYQDMSPMETLWRLSIHTSCLFKNALSEMTARECFNKEMSFPVSWREVALDNDLTISGDGIHSYSGDPDMYPYIKFIGESETVFIYPYSWVYIVPNEGKAIISRVD